MKPHAVHITPVRTNHDLAATAALFRAYAASLDIDLGYQDFDAELQTLPGLYAPPGGELLLARNARGDAAGCVAVRPLGEGGVCELKRLFVTPSGRGAGLGKRLIAAAVQAAERARYTTMYLDTLPTMLAAAALYAKLGFEPAPAYGETYLEGTMFMRRPLTPG